MEPNLAASTRQARRAQRRRSHHAWLMLTFVVVLVGTAAAIGLVLYNSGRSNASAAPAAPSSTRPRPPSTTTAPTTATTTLPQVAQPPQVLLPELHGTLGPGSSGDVVRAYQQRLADVHFDPGVVDGRYGDGTVSAVQALQKLYGFDRTGRIGDSERFALGVFQYPPPLQPNGERNRTEIDVAKQVITLYENFQVRLITATSTGSGEHYCYDSPRDNPTRHICEVATTPSGRFTYTRFVGGWDKSPLGELYQPFYFNGGIAIHGYPSVPTTPASHGCTRIPMHIAEYFHTLVKVGDPVYVFGGTPEQILSSTPIVPAPPPPAPVPPPVTTPPATTPSAATPGPPPPAR